MRSVPAATLLRTLAPIPQPAARLGLIAAHYGMLPEASTLLFQAGRHDLRTTVLQAAGAWEDAAEAAAAGGGGGKGGGWGDDDSAHGVKQEGEAGIMVMNSAQASTMNAKAGGSTAGGVGAANNKLALQVGWVKRARHAEACGDVEGALRGYVEANVHRYGGFLCIHKAIYIWPVCICLYGCVLVFWHFICFTHSLCFLIHLYTHTHTVIMYHGCLLLTGNGISCLRFLNNMVLL